VALREDVGRLDKEQLGDPEGLVNSVGRRGGKLLGFPPRRLFLFLAVGASVKYAPEELQNV